MPVFTPVFSCLLTYTSVFLCLLVFNCVPRLTRVYIFLTMFTHAKAKSHVWPSTPAVTLQGHISKSIMLRKGWFSNVGSTLLKNRCYHNTYSSYWWCFNDTLVSRSHLCSDSNRKSAIATPIHY